MQANSSSLSVVVIGASGDLARKKIFPALFSLFSQNFLPKPVSFIGFARSELNDTSFRARIAEQLTCRYVPSHDCERWQQEFLALCHYVRGQYDSADSFGTLRDALGKLENGAPANRLYYFAIPPGLFAAVAWAMSRAGLVSAAADRTWSRVIIEKPFGRDRESSDQLARELTRVFSEKDIYRIDHYLGKEIVQNLMVLRFANVLFEPIWNREFIEQIQITWKENIGIEERGGYFDEYGIIRDVVQNHLMQMLALLAMERPAAIESHALRNAKTDVLRAIPPLKLSDLVIGQYTAGRKQPGYREERDVRPDSITPTFAAMELRIENERWRGVPVLLRAGKGLDRRINEIHARFRAPAVHPFGHTSDPLMGDHLVIRIHPDEAIELHILNKAPGAGLQLVERELDLRYASAFTHVIPEAYENLLLDAIEGDKGLFIRDDELAAAWDIFTPALHALEKDRIQPVPYPFGSFGPREADQLPKRYKTYWFEDVGRKMSP